MKTGKVAVPPHLLPDLRGKSVEADIDGFRVRLKLVSAKAAGKLDKKKHRTTEARVGDRIYPALTPYFGTVSYNPNEEEYDKLSLGDKDIRDGNVAAVKRIAHEYSRLTRIAVHMHSLKVLRSEPLPTKPDEIHILFGAIPPGRVARSYDLSEAFGQILDTRAMYYPRTHPVKGRGVVRWQKDDKDKRALVQVVNRTAYLLMPVLGLNNRPAIDPVFKGLLGLIHEALPLAAKRMAKPVRSAQAFNRRYHQLRKEFHDWRIEREKEMVEKVASTLKEYQNALDDLRSFKTASPLVHAADLKIVRGMAKRGDFDRIKEMSEVDHIEFLDEGLHVVTKLVTCTYDGQTHRLGRYVIRLADHDFSLFCEESHHPKGTIHPHYPNDGTPCWGNVGIPLARAQSEGRLADLVELVIKWLTQGYDPVLANTKLEEWPVIEEKVR